MYLIIELLSPFNLGLIDIDIYFLHIIPLYTFKNQNMSTFVSKKKKKIHFRNF